MFRISRFLILLTCFAVLNLTGCNDSSSSKKHTVDPAFKGYPNGGLLATAANLNESGTVILDARSAAAYASGHIPGALSMPWQNFSDAELNLKPVFELETLLGAAGIKRDTWMIIYDDTTASWGAAGRLFWMFEYLGCPNARILDGGWDKWVADGNMPETSSNTRKAAAFTAKVNDSVVVDKEHIADRMKDSDFSMIDTRVNAEFIGWQLYGETRGGHIPGAAHLPYESYFQTDKTIPEYTAMKDLFESKGVTPDKEVAAYCTAGIRSAYAYFICRLMGYGNVVNYDASIWDWAAADANDYPMDKMENYQALVHPAWLDDLIKGKNPDTYPGNGYVVLFTCWEARYEENRTDYVGTPYETGHIPGAVFMDTYAIENGPNSEYGDGYAFPEEGNVKPIAELQQLFGSLGISRDMTVVVYADDDISMMTAGRTAWALLLAGVNDVRLLNGNYDAWVAYGGEIETAPNLPTPVDFGGGDGNPQYLADTEDVHAVIDLTNTDSVIVDDREWAEFVGSSNSYYHYFEEYGRVPTAQWIGDWVELVRTSEYLQENSADLMAAEGDGSNTDSQYLRIYTEVENHWTTSGFDKDKTMIFYCGTGWRSAQYTFYAYLMGWPAANYDGGWFEWSYYDNPREKGNTDKLVDAEWLKEMMDNSNGGSPYVIIETGWGPVGDAYNNGHIPETIWVNTDEIEYDCFNARNDWPVAEGDPPCWDRSTTEAEDAAKGLGPDDSLPRNWWNIYPDAYLLPAIAYMGVDADTTVVVYGDDPTGAARLLWALMYAGVKDVRFLDGGKTAWTAAGYDLETAANTRRPVSEFDPANPGRVTAIHPEYKVDIPYVRDVVNRIEKGSVLVDIRTWDEYIGATAPYSYIPTSGRIPGAVWGKAGDGPWTMEAYVNADGTLAPEKIYPYWNSIGLTTDKHLNFYCGTAWRSSLTWFVAYLIGYPEISNFDSSWFEWSMGEGSAYNGDSPLLNPIVDQRPGLPAKE